MLKYGRLNYSRHRFMAWSQNDFWKTTWQSVLISSCLEFWGRSQHLLRTEIHTWNLSLPHIQDQSASRAPNHPENPWTKSQPFGSKATHVIASAPKCKYHLILSPSCPAPLDFITSLYLSLSISRFAFTGGERQEEKDDSIFDFKEIKEIDKQKEAKLLHTQHIHAHVRYSNVFQINESH